MLIALADQPHDRRVLITVAVRLEAITLTWLVAEAAVALGSGQRKHVRFG